MSELRVRFGNRLKEIRNIRQITQEQLAERVGVSVEFISLIERGIRAPSFETIEKIAEALSVPPADLFQ